MGHVLVERVLDHGYVRSVESWGSDEAVIEAARMSTQKGFEGWGSVFRCKKCKTQFSEDLIDPANVRGYKCVDGTEDHDWERKGDEKLLRYLWANKHHTPFEMAGLIVEVQAPIFVFREWHRHRTQSYNEMSARYAPLPDLNYVPTVERVMRGGGHLTKQAAGTGAEITEDHARNFIASLTKQYESAERDYQSSLTIGVPKELARLVLPVGRYSRMRASANLRNWLGFLALRADKHAQWEIQQYAWAVHAMLAELFPRTLALFDEGRPPR